MTLHLGAHDQRRLATATEALLTRHDGTAESWWARVEPSLRALFPGANAMLSYADGDRLRFVSSTADAAALRTMTELSAVDPDTGMLRSADPVPETWYRYRRAHRIATWDEPFHVALMAKLGLRVDASPFRMDGLLAAGLHRYAGMTSDLPRAGDMIVTLGYAPPFRPRAAPDTALLALLLPAFRAAHHAHVAAAGRQRAAVETLGAGGDAVLAVAPDGRELHRTVVLRELLTAEPERERLEAAMTCAARALVALHRGRADAATLAAAPPSRTLATARGRYAVRATFASELVWGAPGVVLVSVSRDATAPALADVARTLGLTAREAEVARLLAERLTNAELASALGISAHTARHHTERVMRKVGASTRRALAARLRTAGWQ